MRFVVTMMVTSWSNVEDEMEVAVAIVTFEASSFVEFTAIVFVRGIADVRDKLRMVLRLLLYIIAIVVTKVNVNKTVVRLLGLL